MITADILAALGIIIGLLLAINAYFIRGMLESLNQVKIQTAVLISQTISYETRLKNSEEEIRMIRERIHNLVNDFGGRIQMLERTDNDE